jgi:microcystin-dependent protein
MAEPYIGEIRMAGFRFAPAGWALCDGSLQPISGNEALFQLIGTTYGGDGQSTFALPNLQSRVPIHMGTGPGLTARVLGETGGSETVTVTTAQLPAHKHTAQAQLAAGNQQGPGGNVWATSTLNLYGTTAAPDATMNAACLGATGGNQPHENMLPFVCVNFIISLFGIFPSQN